MRARTRTSLDIPVLSGLVFPLHRCGTQEGRLTVEAVPNCTHVDWLTSKDIFTNYVLPHLD